MCWNRYTVSGNVSLGVISHGYRGNCANQTGWPLDWLKMAYIVASLDHRGTNELLDQYFRHCRSNGGQRPMDITRLIDWLLKGVEHGAS